jgi:hypothetical protein
VVALSDHPFFVGTLYQPQISSAPDDPHPLIVAYLRAALAQLIICHKFFLLSLRQQVICLISSIDFLTFVTNA